MIILLFVPDSFVSLVGSSVKVPANILWDTGASESFVVESVFPFYGESIAGSNALVRGLGCKFCTGLSYNQIWCRVK